jgi:hypothetical protein
MMWYTRRSPTVNAFSLDILFLSLRISSQNLEVVKPSVAIVIFFSNKKSASFLGDSSNCIGGLNTSAIDFFERPAIGTVDYLMTLIIFCMR